MCISSVLGHLGPALECSALYTGKRESQGAKSNGGKGKLPFQGSQDLLPVLEAGTLCLLCPMNLPHITISFLLFLSQRI